MIEQLSSGNVQRFAAELAQGRLDALLRIGQVQTGTVVEVSPQPARQNTAQPQATTSQVRQSAETTASATKQNPAAEARQPAANLTYVKPQAKGNTTASASQTHSTSFSQNPSSTTTTSRNSGTLSPATASTTTNPNTTTNSNSSANAQAFQTRINVQGTILNIITPTPLSVGSQVSLTRDSQNQLIVSTNTTATTTTPANKPAESAAQRLPMLQLGETANARVTQSRADNAAPQGTMTNNAQATRTSSTAPASNSQGYITTITVKGTAVEIQTPKPIPPGTDVKITLDKSGQVSVQLPAPARLAADQALRENLPIQQPFSQLLNALQDPALSQQLSRNQPLLNGLLQLLMGRSLTSPQQTDSGQVKQQLLNSGAQLENKIARSDSQSIKQDAKALLLQLQNRLSSSAQTQNLPQSSGQRITEMTQQAISRVLVNQLSSISQHTHDADGDKTRVLVTDIPILWQQQNENLQLRITQRQPSTREDEDAAVAKWQVQLRFEMEDTPPMRVDLTLEGSDISVLFFGDPSTKEWVSPHLGNLQSALENVGLNVATLQVRDKLPEETKLPSSHSPLVDIKT